jgi:hypothetical protein
MTSSRSADELRVVRRGIFDRYPTGTSAKELLEFQRLLVWEILEAEAEQIIDRSPIRTEHIQAVRIYGDALAFGQLSTYAIRQLARSTGNSPQLTGQGRGFEHTLECAEGLTDQGVPVLIADITNVLKNGDLVVCVDPNAPVLMECKLSKVKDARFERLGRRGRQLSRLESIGNVLRTGRGRIFGEAMERVTVELTEQSQFDYFVVEQIVTSALEHKPTVVTPSRHQLLSAALLGESVDAVDAIRRWAPAPAGDRVAVGSSLTPLRKSWPDISPPILWQLSPRVQWALMEGDVSVTHAVRVDAFVGMQRDQACVNAVIAIPSGRFPWGYELTINAETLTIGPNFLLDVVHSYETLESAGRRLLEAGQMASVVLAG